MCWAGYTLEWYVCEGQTKVQRVLRVSGRILSVGCAEAVGRDHGKNTCTRRADYVSKDTRACARACVRVCAILSLR